MDKPERVEVGQWWVVPDEIPTVRIEATDAHGGHLYAVHSDGHGETACWYLIRDGVYLGSGDHPEPSEWMVETCARHCFNMSRHIPPYPSITDWDAPSMPREQWLDAARRLIRDGDAGEMCAIEREAVTDLYRILRDPGKW